MKTKATKQTKTRQARKSATKSKGQSAEFARVPRRTAGAVPSPSLEVPAARLTTKKATIAALMRRPKGSAIPELMAATGWQEHSIRAALTGLRKAGCTIERDKTDGASRYRIVGAL